MSDSVDTVSYSWFWQAITSIGLVSLMLILSENCFSTWLYFIHYDFLWQSWKTLLLILLLSQKKKAVSLESWSPFSAEMGGSCRRGGHWCGGVARSTHQHERAVCSDVLIWWFIYRIQILTPLLGLTGITWKLGHHVLIIYRINKELKSVVWKKYDYRACVWSAIFKFLGECSYLHNSCVLGNSFPLQEEQ